MNKIKHVSREVVAVMLLLGLAACAGMSAQDKHTAIGAGDGAVGWPTAVGGVTRPAARLDWWCW